MSQYKLIYFNFRGRAEVIRMLFAVADQEYEDFRFEREEWPKYKPTTPFGQVPVLEVDGQVLCQSHAIERFLAKRFGRAGNTALEQAKADMVVGCVEDYLQPLVKSRQETDEDKKKEILKKYIDEQLPVFMDSFNKMLTDSGYFVGNEMTYADIVFYHFTTNMQVRVGQDIDMNRWPKLVALQEKVQSHPKIAAWIEKRPVTSL